MSAQTSSPLGIFYEHPDWFRPLFAELETRGIAYERLDARAVRLDPGAPADEFGLIFNRMSPSAFQRGAPEAVFAAAELIGAWEDAGVPVVNGSRAWATEMSKIRQLRLVEELGLGYPRSRFVHLGSLREAALEIGFPLVVKPNLGGSGVGVARFDGLEELETALATGAVDLGPSGA